MLRCILLIILDLLLLLNSVLPQDKTILTLEECLQLGLENSRRLKSAAFDRDAANAKAKETIADMLPSLAISGKYARLSEVPPFSIEMGLPAPFPQEITISETILNYYSLKLTVQQPIFAGFRLKHLSASAEFDAAAAKWNYQSAENDLMMDIQSAFWQLYKMRQYHQVFTQNVDMLKAHLSDAQNFYQQGMITKDELLKVQSSLAAAKLLLLKSEHSIDLAELLLKNKIGLNLNTPLDIQAEPALPNDNLPSPETAKNMALENRPELKSMAQKLNSAQALTAASNSAYYPHIFLTGNYYCENPHQRYMPAEDKFHDSWDIGIGVSYNLWNWGKTSQQKQQSMAWYKKALQSQQDLRHAIILEVTQAWLELDQAQEQIVAAQQSLDAASESCRISGERFKQGLALNSELLDAESDLLKARIDHLTLLADYQIALAAFRRAAAINTNH